MCQTDRWRASKYASEKDWWLILKVFWGSLDMKPKSGLHRDFTAIHCTPPDSNPQTGLLQKNNSSNNYEKNKTKKPCYIFKVFEGPGNYCSSIKQRKVKESQENHSWWATLPKVHFYQILRGTKQLFPERIWKLVDSKLLNPKSEGCKQKPSSSTSSFSGWQPVMTAHSSA